MIYGIIRYGINLVVIVSLHNKPSFETDSFTPRNFTEFFSLLAPHGIPGVTNACQAGSGLILRSAATLSVGLKSLPTKTLGLTPDTAYCRGK
jgi:hypothetical protein